MGVLAAFLLVAALVGADLVQDLREGTATIHLGLEGAGALVALVAAAWTVRAALRARTRDAEALRQATVDVARSRERSQALADEAARWKAEAEGSLRGLGEAIEQQLVRWDLTEAEAEVAALLLKGLSTKEIASARDTTDRTVRQQAQQVYAKAGLAGRAELSAFFLEDLFPPRAR